MILTHQLLESLAQTTSILRIGESELDERLEITLEITNIIPLFIGRQADADNFRAGTQEKPDCVGQLQLTMPIKWSLTNCPENGRCKDVSGSDGHPARRFVN